MSNRKKIEKFCKDNDIQIVRLVYKKDYNTTYGCDDSRWMGNFSYCNVEFYEEGTNGDDMVEFIRCQIEYDAMVELAKARRIIKNLIGWAEVADVAPEVFKSSSPIWLEAKQFVDLIISKHATNSI
jgi:hypothetical protein